MIFRDSLNAPYRPIGMVQVPVGTARKSFETASWFEEIAYKAQTVMVFSNGYYVKWTVTGTVIDANFASEFGGVRVGSYDKSRDVGKVTSYTFTAYAYGWAEGMTNGSHVNNGLIFMLMPEYGVGSAPYKHDPSKIGHFITMPDSGHPLQVTLRPSKGFTDKHVYRVTFRGERLANIIVQRSEGVNGDTRNVAYSRAAEGLSL
jgi:hypothetical protein